MRCRKIDLVPLNVHSSREGWGGGRGGGRSRELPVNAKNKRSRIVVIYFAKSFTERLENSEFQDSMILFPFFVDFRRYS